MLVIPAVFLCSCASQPMNPLPTVSRVDLSRYMGKWHEVARLPMFFQRGCVRSTAEYSMQADASVLVINTCQKKGKAKQVRGTAEVVDPETNAVLEVRFDEWFSAFIPRARAGNYFVVWLADDYSAAAVGTPDRKCLWILARGTELPKAVWEEIIEHCSSLGFPVEKLIIDANQPG